MYYSAISQYTIQALCIKYRDAGKSNCPDFRDFNVSI